MNSARRPRLCVEEKTRTILQWPTDTVEVDYYKYCLDDSSSQMIPPHTVLVFVPGNPGCIGWYSSFLEELVRRLGPGFAARGVSYAGHGRNLERTNVEGFLASQNRDTSIPWTVDGQIQHKSAYLDLLEQENDNSLHYIFLGHSIGAHMVHRLLLLRPNILQRTKLFLQLMPFVRMDAPEPQQQILDFGARNPLAVIGSAQTVSRVLAKLPMSWMHKLLKSVPDAHDRQLGIDLVRQPTFLRNFFELGLEELRDVPETPDICGMRFLLSKQCRVAMLFAGDDHWGPAFHVTDWHQWRERGQIPSDHLRLVYNPDLRHDYIVHKEMVPTVLEFCWDSMVSNGIVGSLPHSRL